MNCIQFNLRNDILHIKLTAKVTKGKLLQQAILELQGMIDRDELIGGSFIGVNGPCTVGLAYALSEILCHRFSTVGVYDLKLPGYVIVKTDSASHEIGEVIDIPEDGVQRPMKVVICGPPHAGKSCLRFGLKSVLMDAYLKQICPYPYIYEACPDGEGAWYPETMERYLQVAEALKEKYKSSFTDAFVQETSEVIQKIREPLTLIDIGGIDSPENEEIVQGATHAVILWRDRFQEHSDPNYSSLDKWQAFCLKSGLNVIAILKSDYTAQNDVVDSKPAILSGRVHHLARGCKLSDRPAIQALSQTIIQEYHDYSTQADS